MVPEFPVSSVVMIEPAKAALIQAVRCPRIRRAVIAGAGAAHSVTVKVALPAPPQGDKSTVKTSTSGGPQLALTRLPKVGPVAATPHMPSMQRTEISPTGFIVVGQKSSEQIRIREAPNRRVT